MDVERIGILSLSISGSAIASYVSNSEIGQYTDVFCLNTPDDIAIDFQKITAPLKPTVSRLFEEYSQLIMIMPVGVAFRLLADVVSSKYEDPAVVCIDDGGNYVISMLSGHIGGADALSAKVARIIKAQPIITSSSYALNKISVDLLGRDFGWKIDCSSKIVTTVSSAVINNKPIAVFQDVGDRSWTLNDSLDYSNLTYYDSLEEFQRCGTPNRIVITDLLEPNVGRLEQNQSFNTVLVRPPTLHVGIGCRKDVDQTDLFDFLLEVLSNHNLSIKSVCSISTITLKKDEIAIQHIANTLSVPLKIYSPTEIEELFNESSLYSTLLTRSENPKRLIGVWGVSEPAAILAAGNGELIVKKHKSKDATIAVAR